MELKVKGESQSPNSDGHKAEEFFPKRNHGRVSPNAFFNKSGISIRIFCPGFKRCTEFLSSVF